MNTTSPPLFPNEAELLRATPASTATGDSLADIAAAAGMPEGAPVEARDCARVVMDTLFCRAWIERRVTKSGVVFRRTPIGDRAAGAVP